METRKRKREKTESAPTKPIMKPATEPKKKEEKVETTSDAVLLAEQICKDIKMIDEKYSKIDMSDWNLDEIAEELSKPDKECSVKLTSDDDVEDNDSEYWVCDEIYASGENDIKLKITPQFTKKVEKEIRSVTAIPQLTYEHLRWLIRTKIVADLRKVIEGKLSSFYHTNFTREKKEMPAALIRRTMFNDNQFKYICGCLKGLFVQKKSVYELNYALHVLLPETLIRMVMFVKKIEYKDAQKLMDTHLFSKSTSSDPLE